MKNYFKENISIIEKSVLSMDEREFELILKECEETIKKGNKIIVSGLGKNVPVCEKFVGTMNSLGISSNFMNTNSAIHGDLGIVKDGDLVIILTKSGETSESVYLVKLLKERNVDLWLLSFQKDSILYKEVPKHLILNLQHEGDQWNIMPNNSTTVNLIVLQGLAVCLAEKLGITLHDFKKNHPGGAIGEQLKNEPNC